jgi:hypothetical protein
MQLFFLFDPGDYLGDVIFVSSLLKCVDEMAKHQKKSK